MIKSFMINITEIDDTEFALEELESQLSAQELLKNTVGIATVNTEFLNSGVYTGVVNALPFPVLGMSAYSQNANGNTGIFLFSIMVLTSDTCEFAHCVSEVIPEAGDVTALTQDLYKKISVSLESRAKVAFLYAPFLPQQCPYNYLQSLSELDASLPVFGSIASCEVTKMGVEERSLYGGAAYKDRLVMLLAAGDVSPRFYIGSITKESVIMPDIGEVTAAKDNIVMEVNNTKVDVAFKKIGFEDGAIKDAGAITLVFIAEEKDSGGNVISATARSLYVVDDGIAAFGGRMAVGSTLSVAATTKEVILETGRDVLSQIKSEHHDKAVLLYSCLGRQIALLGEPMAEYDFIGEEFQGSGFTYVMAASGGELCPTSLTEAKAYNSEHNQTLIACVL